VYANWCSQDMWLNMMKYPAEHNITADKTLDWQIPLGKQKGETPVISVFLQCKYCVKIETQMKFPSTKERPGYWLGVAHNVGNSLTYVILTTDTRQIIERSVICSAEDPKTKNKEVVFDPNLEPDFTDNAQQDDGFTTTVIATEVYNEETTSLFATLSQYLSGKYNSS
jgi:hypothetical protein